MLRTARTLVLAACLAAFRGEVALAVPRLGSATGGQVRAVVVGVDAYRNFNSLRGARADAADLAGALGDGGAKVTALLDDQATRASVVAAMDGLVASSHTGDLAVVSFAGHGARVPEYNFPGWKGVEPGGTSEEFVLGRYSQTGEGAAEVVVNKEMKAWLSRLDAKGVDVIFVADTCFGGGLVRSFDPRTAPPSFRGTRTVQRPEPGRFKPIPMTMAELLTDVSTLRHVTFVGGADSAHEVPEVTIPGEPSPRGALSYSVARLLRGGVEVGDGSAVTRETLFRHVLQSVSQYTEGQQEVDRAPKSLDPAVIDRPVIRLSDAQPAAQLVPVTPSLEAREPLKVAIIHGDASAVGSVSAASPPFVLVDQSQAEVTWDLGTSEVVVHGDIVRRGADVGELPGILYKVLVAAALKQISEARLLTVRLERGGVAYKPGGKPPTFHAPNVEGHDLVAFNLTATGVVQVLFPYKGLPATVEGSSWDFTPDVVAPFGSDEVVVVSAARGRLADFATWAWTQDQRPAAAILPARLRELVATAPDVRIGTVDLVTAP